MIELSKELLDKMKELSFYIIKSDYRSIYLHSEEREKRIIINIDLDMVIFMNSSGLYEEDPSLDEVELCGDIIKDLRKKNWRC